MEEVDFGFFFCRVMAFYSQSYPQVMALPLKTFWLMSGNIDRIRAQQDMRSLTLTTRSQSPEAATALCEQLIVETGKIVKVKEVSPLHAVRDEAGFAELKRMASQS